MIKKIVLFIAISFIISCSYIEVKKDVISKNIGREIKILQISDLHLNKNKAIYKKLIKKINTIKPDLLLITGDSIDKSENLHLLNEFLKQLEPNIIKYSILGNWEYWSKLDLKDLDSVYNDNDVKLLVNQSDEISTKNLQIYIYGTDDLVGGNPDIKNIKVDSKKLTLIMTHCPKYFDHISETLKQDELYVFSGHTHGGQITFFGKPLFLPEGSGKYIKGIYKNNNSTLYVSKGIGNSVHDFRLFATPDIFLIIVK